MPRVNAPLYSLNGGEVGDEALSRLDLERLQFAGSLYSNMLPRVVGSMTLRPGLEHVATIPLGDVAMMEYSHNGQGSASLIPLLSSYEMRVLKDGAFITRSAVSTTIANGDFGSFSGWTNASDAGASATVSGGFLVLGGTSQSRAVARQSLSIALADRGVEHGLRINVLRGPVSVRIGTSAGASDVMAPQTLDDGAHSIAFTPSVGTVVLEFFSDKPYPVLVDSCSIDAAGTVILPTPWPASDLPRLRYRQNNDVVYTASGIYQQREIQRRSDVSWGIQRYKSDDGPFVKSDGSILLTPSAMVGTAVLSSSRPYFTPGMVGRLFRLVQSGQTVYETFVTGPAEGAYIRVAGVGSNRSFVYSISGTWTGTVRLQVATETGSGVPGAWSDVATFSTNAGTTYTDEDNNVVKYFRFIVPVGGYVSGEIETSLIYPGGSQIGIVRATSYSDATAMTVDILGRLYSLQATAEWDYSVWSDHDGWPSAVETFGGRLFWGKGDFVHGSVPDAYKSFDNEVEGDSAPIFRSIGSSSSRGILWLLGLQRLMAGTDNAEVSIKSSSFDDPLTADRWFPLETSTQGSLSLRAVKCDKDGIFVQSSGTGIFSLVAEQGSLDYGALDLTEMHEEICDGFRVVSMAVQRRPDTVVWFVLENGEGRALTYRPSQQVIAWSRVVTEGQFKSVIASRGTGQDTVHFVVVRNGVQRIERLAKLDECRGGPWNCLADGFARFTTTAGQTTFPVSHLNGLQVTVWVEGVALHDQDNLYTVTGNNVVIPAQTAGKRVVIGLPYVGRWKSTKLAYGAANGTALFQKKRVSQLGLYLVKTMLDGLRVGKDFATLRKLTTTKSDKPIPAGHLWEDYDADMMSVSSDWDTDSRVCLEQRSPYPFTAASLVMDINTHG